jgi:hypothetical protein
MTQYVMRSRAGLEHGLAALRPRGRVVAMGSKSSPLRTGPLRLSFWFKARRGTTFEGFARAFNDLGELVRLEVEPMTLGAVYIATSRKPAEVQPPSEARWWCFRS